MQPLRGGFVNDMTMLVTDDGARYVLRRFLGPSPRETCLVEMALANRLAGTVPVGDVVASDPDGRTDGTPALLSRFVPGVVLSRLLPTLARRDAAAVGHAVGTVLARIGTLSFPRPGGFRDGSLRPDGRTVVADLPGAVDRCVATSTGLSAREQDAVRALAARDAEQLDAVEGARQLVHMDFNPKNVMMRCERGRWGVAAVLDWEFAHSGSPLTDVGNMLRFADGLPPGFAVGFRDGFRAGGGLLPERWREISAALDLFTVVGMLADPPDETIHSKIVAVLRRRLADAV